MSLGTATVLHGDARSIPLTDASVDLVLTRPPRWGGGFGDPRPGDAVGTEPSLDGYIESLIAVTQECVRVLKPSGSLWVTLPDAYTSTEHAVAVRAGSLLGTPWRYAVRCIDDLGLILRSEVIVRTPASSTQSDRDRVARGHQQWFHFTRQQRYYSCVDEIREAYVQPDRVRADVFGGRSAALGVRHAGPSTYTGPTNPLGKLPGSVWKTTLPGRIDEDRGDSHLRRILRGWAPAQVCTDCEQGRRPITATEQHARRPIGEIQVHTAYDARAERGTKSNIGHVLTSRTITGYACGCSEPTGFAVPGVVLDPFGRGGDVAQVAQSLGLNVISLDLDADRCRTAEARLTTAEPDPSPTTPEVHGGAVPAANPARTDDQLSLFSSIDGDDAA